MNATSRCTEILKGHGGLPPSPSPPPPPTPGGGGGDASSPHCALSGQGRVSQVLGVSVVERCRCDWAKRGNPSLWFLYILELVMHDCGMGLAFRCMHAYMHFATH